MRVYDLTSTTIYKPAKAYNGYTLFSPMGSFKFYLIDMQGRVVKTWGIAYKPALHGVILPNGNLLYAGQIEQGPFPLEFGGAGGLLIEIDWEGNEIWRYEDLYMHHDFFRMDNGNTMILRFDAAPDDIAVKYKGGISETERKGIVWFASFHEIDRDGNVVWEWKGYEHFDPDIDVMCPLCPRCEFDHCNSCKVLPDGNIMTTSLTLNNVYIIEKGSGDIVWRWGKAEGELAHPHDPSLLDNGHILVFDNGLHRSYSYPAYSRILEIDSETGIIVWQFQESSPVNFFGSFISGAQRLPNGNTMICEGPKGHFFEVTPNGEVVWEYYNPFYQDIPIFNIKRSNLVFRAHRYDPDYSGFKGKELDPKKHEWLNQICSK